MKVVARLGTAIGLVASVVIFWAPASSAADAPISLVEDFTYPGTDQILAEYGVKVLKGDGGIRFAPDCGASDNYFRVEQLLGSELHSVCFETRAPRGFVTLDVPYVYLVRGGTQPVRATATRDGQTVTALVEPGTYEAIGDGSPVHTLVELRVPDGTPLPPGQLSPQPAVARVEVDGRACSGVLVQRQWVLTAKSCFAADGSIAAGPAPASAKAIVGRSDLNQASGVESAISRVVPHPTRDLVLVALTSPNPTITPMALATAPAVVGETVTVAGYGRSATDWSATAMRATSFVVASAASERLELTRAAGTVTSTCRGDAGGPTFRTGGSGKPELLAIHTASWQTGCFGVTETRDLAVEVPVHDLAQWIAENTQRPATDFDQDWKADVIGYNTAGGAPTAAPNTSTAGSPSLGQGVALPIDWTGARSPGLVPNARGGYDLTALVGDTLLLWPNTSTPGHPSVDNVSTAPMSIKAGADATEAYAMDLNGVGSVEYVIFGEGSMRLCYYTTLAGRPWLLVFACTASDNSWAGITGRRLVDFDNDGKPDLVGRVGAEVRVWRNISTATAPKFVPAAEGISLGYWWNADAELALADLDGDRLPDVLAIGPNSAGTSPEGIWYTGNNSSPGSPSVPPLAPSSSSVPGLANATEVWCADYDGDSRVDLLGRVGDSLYLWRNTGMSDPNPSLPQVPRRPTFAAGVSLGTGWSGVNGFVTPYRFF